MGDVPLMEEPQTKADLSRAELGQTLTEGALTLDLEHQVATVDELHHEVETVLYTHEIATICKSNNLGLEGGQKVGQERRAIGKGKHTTLSQRALDIIIQQYCRPLLVTECRTAISVCSKRVPLLRSLRR